MIRSSSSIFCLVFIAVFVIESNAAFTRQHYTINTSPWKFIRRDTTGAQAVSFDDASWQTVSIPHDFNGGIDGVNNDVYSGPSMYRGIGWYRKHFTIDAQYSAQKVFIEFEAVSLVSDVWVNGQYAGNHKGGYTAFSFDITSFVNFGADNILAVKANSANDSTVAPWAFQLFAAYPSSQDYAVYGGIYRDVWITITDKAKIEHLCITTPAISKTSATVRVRTEVKNYDAAPVTATLTTEILDSNLAVVQTLSASQTIAASATDTFDQTSTAIANPHLWSPDGPYLYSVQSTITVGGQSIDQQNTPFGMRWFVLKNNQAFMLNGDTSLIRGTNRHQDWLGYGYALSNQQHWDDARLIKNLGLNFVRHAHYPADPEFLNACDKLGLMVWLEIPASTCIPSNADFLASSKSQLTEMIRNNINHPCIITWGLGNESDQSNASTEANLNTFFTQLNDLAHVLDSTRPTNGCNWRYGSNQAIVDVYSPQEWSGWYGGSYTGYSPSQLIAEYGADMVLGSHTENGTTQSSAEEYGCLLHEYKASIGESRFGQFPGHCTWVAFDFASPRSDRGPAYKNIKGLFANDHTAAKDVSYFYRSMFADKHTAPMVYIVSHTWLNRWTAAAKKTVWCYSNCDSVELFNDYGSISFGKRARTAGERHDTRFQWDSANVQYNILYAEGYVNGTCVAKDTIKLLNLPDVPATASRGNIASFNRVPQLAYHANSEMISVRFDNPLSVPITVVIYNVLGRPVARLTAHTGVQAANWRISDLPAGVFYAAGSWPGAVAQAPMKVVRR